MIRESLKAQFEFSSYAIHKNIEGVSEEESYRVPAGGGNCLNWVLGHIVHSRRLILDHFGAEAPLEAEHAAVYGRGSARLGSATGAVPLEELVRALDASQECLQASLSEADEDLFRAEVPGLFQAKKLEPRGIQLAALAFHESYHTGQLGTVRTAIGKGPAIR